jgi:hypothetical protein
MTIRLRTAGDVAVAVVACGIILKWAAEGVWVVAKRKVRR